MFGRVGVLELVVMGAPAIGVFGMGLVGAGTVLTPSLLGLFMVAVIARAS